MDSSNQQMRPAIPGQNQNTQISSKEFQAKYNSKREIYNFLAADVGVYLPPYDNVTIYFLKDIMSGKKQMVSTKRVRTIHIPQYEGLGVKEIQEFLLADHKKVFDFLPDPEIELPKTPKQWIANVCATVLEDKFARWVKQQIDKRHAKVAVEKDLMIQVDPEIAKVFRQSTAVSTNKGVSAQLLQTGSKRRRTKKQIEEDKQAQFLQEQQAQAKLSQYDALQVKVQMMEANNQSGLMASDLMQQFIDAGYVKQTNDGVFTVPGISKERKFKPFQGK